MKLEDFQEVGLNKGIAYRKADQQWYPVERKAAVHAWVPIQHKHHELPTYVHFSTKEAAINYFRLETGTR